MQYFSSKKTADRTCARTSPDLETVFNVFFKKMEHFLLKIKLVVPLGVLSWFVVRNLTKVREDSKQQEVVVYYYVQ